LRQQPRFAPAFPKLTLLLQQQGCRRVFHDLLSILVVYSWLLLHPPKIKLLEKILKEKNESPKKKKEKELRKIDRARFYFFISIFVCTITYW
jgi:hypothetical protein